MSLRRTHASRLLPQPLNVAARLPECLTQHLHPWVPHSIATEVQLRELPVSAQDREEAPAKAGREIAVCHSRRWREGAERRKSVPKSDKPKLGPPAQRPPRDYGATPRTRLSGVK